MGIMLELQAAGVLRSAHPMGTTYMHMNDTCTWDMRYDIDM